MINVLPQNVAEKIAAGEVVENPLSVVKELVENSIDAKAKAITVEVKGGGIAYIRVTDDGVGMSEEDAKKAFLRHATSKISGEDDLYSIATMGFRGEALYAISAVSKVQLRTKRISEHLGTQVNVSGGEFADSFVSPMNDGTTIEVSELFFNTPARMKFLKSDRREAALVTDFLGKIALAHPEIAFKLFIDAENKLTTVGNGDLQQAIYAVYGGEIAKNLVLVENTQDGIEVKGYIGNAQIARGNRNMQTVFVNSRCVKSPMIANAVEEACKTHMMVGKFPFFVLNIKLPYSEVDINVHPAKTQVKFANEAQAYKAAYWAVRNIFSGNSSKNIEEKVETLLKHEKVKSFSKLDLDKQISFTKFTDKEPEPIFDTVKPNTLLAQNDIPLEKERKEEVKIELVSDCRKTVLPNYKIIGQAFLTYILVEIDDELILIDQHATHERQIFERLMAMNAVDKQMLMVGEKIDFTASEVEVLMMNKDNLCSLGFEFEQFGDTQIMLSAVPTDFPLEEAKAVLGETLDKLSRNGQNLTFDAREEALHTIACKAAIKGNRNLAQPEIKAVVDWALSQSENQTCPHGRPIICKLSKKDIEKMFKRIV